MEVFFFLKPEIFTPLIKWKGCFFNIFPNLIQISIFGLDLLGFRVLVLGRHVMVEVWYKKDVPNFRRLF